MTLNVAIIGSGFGGLAASVKLRNAGIDNFVMFERADELGDEIQTGPYVYITDQNHSYEDPNAPVGWQTPVEAAVKIGSGSWIGTNAVILPGTTLGRNTVVAAGAVVRGEFPDHVVLGGVPAKILRHYSEANGWQAGAPA